MFSADCASPHPPAKALRNILPIEGDESPAGVVKVCDPRHPLFGRRLVVLRRLAARGDNFPISYEVSYDRGGTLIIPVAAVDFDVNVFNGTKLSVDSINELVSEIDRIENDANSTQRSLDIASAEAETSDHRRDRRHSGGDVP
ncbi:hypothetical protein [Komagataeibacter xylinus]|uniref:hypothetical protein n=1 Tax=Komagataeibacter xylinus TaxID=28448 RepID=UPI001013D51D|nr:hypothetical protein [Komagataeibacter xylinus]